MQYGALTEGVLVKRYKRFLADIDVNGEVITAYCPNTGSMLGCAVPGSRVWLSKMENSSRKYPHTLEIIEVDGCLIGINTALPNKLVVDAIENKKIPQLSGYASIRTEVKYGEENSRIDILLEKHDAKCFVEVKNVTLVENGAAYFPDAVTLRGQKHLRELMYVVQQGHRGVIFFCVQHTGAQTVSPAAHIDKDYADLLIQALDNGVEVIAYLADISIKSVELFKELPVILAS